jgi:hypothetical protein
MTDQEARALRDEKLAETDYLMLVDFPLKPAGKMLARIYRQKLRDWPQSEGFPDPVTIPQPDDWAAYKYVEQADFNASLPHSEPGL